MKRKIDIIIIFCAFLSLPYVADAAEIEGVYFEEVYESGGIRLPVQGTGLFRYMGLFKAYVGAIYYEEGLGPHELLADHAKRLEVEYFHAIAAADFGAATNEIMARNVDQKILVRIRPQIDYHNALYRDVEPGDRYALTYIPGRGTELALNGRPLGIIEGEAFAAALFSMWLGERPMNRSFKEQLLGLN